MSSGPYEVRTLGSRTGLQLPLDFGCDRFASSGTEARFGNGFDRSRNQLLGFTLFGQSVRPQPGHPPFSINFPMHDEHKTHGQLGQESPPGYASVRQIEQLISVTTYVKV